MNTSKEMRVITKLFKTTSVKIAYKTTNNIQNYLCEITKPYQQTDPYQNSEYTS
jgi:hypothetical protein